MGEVPTLVGIGCHPAAQEDCATSCLLCVDLDGTLITSDLLWESFYLLFREQPARLLLLPFWLLKGRAYLKRQIAEGVIPDVETLPYNQQVLAYLRDQRAKGQRLALVTASEERCAKAVAEHLGLFDTVIASDGRNNLKGDRKLEAIRRHLGAQDFDYIGDSKADLAVWSVARRALVVGGGSSLRSKVQAMGVPYHFFDVPGRAQVSLFRLLRPHQWAKNVLLVLPVITAHRIWDRWAWLAALWSIVAFCSTASAVYIINDLLDVSTDRRHSSKRNRPLAAGMLAIPTATGVAIGLLFFGSLFAALLPPAFGGLLLLYFVLTTAYSLYLKRKLIIDVVCLAALYTLRIMAGGAATSIAISSWLLAFAMFFFLSLAFVKRYTELIGLTNRPSHIEVTGRGYVPVDLELVRSVGPASGYLSVLVLCLYINSPDVVILYRHPQLLWLICPILLYWITRVWFLAGRERMHDDPVYFALSDRTSLIAGALSAAVMVIAH